MRRTIRAGLAGVLIFVGIAITGSSIAGATGGGPPPPNPNEVAYWCDFGIKYEPVSTPFVVPAPPEGWTWTLLVLKAGSEESTDLVNETFPNPVVGQGYTRTDGKSISHAILCKQPGATTTTAATTTTPTTIATTTTAPCDEENGRECETTTTSTTIATTTTAATTTVAVNCAPLCAGQFGSTTTVPPTTVPPTTVAPPPSDTTAVDQTLPPTTPAPEIIPPTVVEQTLPKTGSATGPMIAVGIVFLLAGFALLLFTRAVRSAA